eukprot:g15056.t1
MNPSFGGVPAFGVRPRRPCSNFHQEALRRWSSNGRTPSPWIKARAEEAEHVTVLGPRGVKAIGGGVEEDRGAKGGAASGAGADGTSSRRSGDVLVQYTAQRAKQQPKDQKLRCRALGNLRQTSSNKKVADVKPGSLAAKWGVEAGSDIVKVRADHVIIAMKPAPIIPKPVPTAAQQQVSRDEALPKSLPMSADKWAAIATGREEVPVPVQLEVEMVVEVMAALAVEEKNGSSIHSITNRVNASADPPHRFAITDGLKVVKKGMGSGKIIKLKGTDCFKLIPEAPAFPTVVEGKGGIISVCSKERSYDTAQELLWCLNLSSDGAFAAKYETDMLLPPSQARVRAFGGLEDEQRKTLGIRVKAVRLHCGTHCIEVEEVVNASVADRAGVRKGDIVEVVGGYALVGRDMTEFRFVSAVAEALFKPKDQTDVHLRFLLLRKKRMTATATATRQGEAKGKGKGKEVQTASGGASGVRWMSHTAAVASMHRRAGWAGGIGDVDGEGGLGKSAAVARARAAARAAGAASTSESDNPTKANGKEKRKAPQRTQGVGSGGGSESRRTVAVPAASSTAAKGNLPFCPPEAVVEREEEDDNTCNRRRQRWDDATPLDAVQPKDPTKSAAQSKARSMRNDHRGGRPCWWAPRTRGSSTSVLKLRPANQVPGRGAPGGREGEEQDVEETGGEEVVQQQNPRGEALSPGAFLLEGFAAGTGRSRVFVPPGLQLVSVGGVDCRHLPFEEARQLAMSGTSGSKLVFDDP